MKKTALVFTLAAWAAGSATGCDATDIGSAALEEMHCPNGDCPDPGDDSSDDLPEEEPPTQPDPAKLRETVIPVDFVAVTLNELLFGTRIHVSHTDFVRLAFPYMDEVCETHHDPNEAECIAECNESDLPPSQRAECRASCRATTTTCHDVCASFEALSYVRWGANALFAGGFKACEPTTCPACGPGTQIARLENRPLPIPAFDEDYTVGPFTYSIACDVNRWAFQVEGNLGIRMSSTGLEVTVPGVTGDPAIICDGAPDPTVEDLALEITFRFPTSGLDIYTDSWLRGDWDVFGEPVDFLFDLQSSISNAAHSATTDALNDVRVRDTYRQAFVGLATRYIQDVNHEVLDNLGNIQAVDGGLKARYWVQ
jgi:hypothetical protein